MALNMSHKKGRNELMMPLGLLGVGETAEVMEVSRDPLVSNCCDTTSNSQAPPACNQTCRVECMGLRPGKTVEMLHNAGRGALLIKVDGTRIALGRGMAMKVRVRRKDS